MAKLHKIETAPGLAFDVLIDGPEGAPLVLLLHGFAESFHTWRAQLAALASDAFPGGQVPSALRADLLRPA